MIGDIFYLFPKIIIFDIREIWNMKQESQKRMVCHLEYQDQHYYFGNLKVLTDNFGKEQLGVGYKSLANHFVNHDKFSNEYCIIRKGELVTSKRNSKQLD